MLERHAAFGVGIPKRLRYLYWQRHQLFESEEADNAVQAALSAYAVPLAAALSVHHRLRREKFHVTSVSLGTNLLALKPGSLLRAMINQDGRPFSWELIHP